MLHLIIALVGVGIGTIITTIITNRRSVGTLRVDHSDPTDNPYLFLELARDVNDVMKMDHVTLQVKVKNYVSHK